MNGDPRPVGGDGTDTERDAWLREALRHAPDAQAGAPSSVRHAILRQAREATASAPTPVRRRAPLAAFWSWLMQPTVATGFAGVMVATMVGVMWWGRPIDEPLREAASPEAAAPSERVAAPGPGSAAPPAALSQVPPGGAAAPPAAPAVDGLRSATRERADVRPRQAPAAGATDMAAAKKTLPPESKAVAAPSQSAETEHRAAADERARDASRAVSATPATAPTTSAAPAGANANRPAPASPPQPMQPPEAARPAAAPKAERPREEDAAPDRSRPDAAARTPAAEEAPAAKAAEPEPQRSAAATALDPARRLEQARGAAAAAADSAPGTSANQSLARRPMPDAATGVAPGENLVARLRAAVAGQPDGWSWQRGSGGEQPMTDAVQAWLGQLDDATRARWQAAAAAAPAADTIAAPLRLFRNGRLHTTVRIEAGAVRLESEADAAAGATVSAAAGAVGAARASVPAAVAASLKAALERAAP